MVFVTGTRAELGLMLRTLTAIERHPGLELSVVATGMHVDDRAGERLSALRDAGLKADGVVDWPASRDAMGLSVATGEATAGLARAYRDLRADAVLVVGDRVEAMAAALAAHVARIPVAHVHGGDRAEGQVDDALRHAITQLSHLHLVATQTARRRVIRLGQDPRTVHLVGAPGVEVIREEAAPREQVLEMFPDVSRSAVVLLHPGSPDSEQEYRHARDVVGGVRRAGVDRIVLLLANNDPGSDGIRRAWAELERYEDVTRVGDLPRAMFLGLIREARVLVGNSSAGVIEAGSFAVPVVNVGERQRGRARGPRVVDVGYGKLKVADAVARAMGLPRVSRARDNPYHRRGTAERIAALLAELAEGGSAKPKLLTY